MIAAIRPAPAISPERKARDMGLSNPSCDGETLNPNSGVVNYLAGCLLLSKSLLLAVMTDSIYQYVLAELEQAKGHWPEVAEGTGISRRTIEKIARQEVE